jgi:hypothetical protein
MLLLAVVVDLMLRPDEKLLLPFSLRGLLRCRTNVMVI